MTLLGSTAAVAPGRAGEPIAPEIRSVDWIVYGPSVIDRFQRPCGVAVDSTRGILVVADSGGHRLALFDAKGRSRGTIPCDATLNEARSCEPKCVAIDTHHRIFSLDALGKEIEVLTPSGARLAHFDPFPGDSLQVRAQALAVGRSGRIYVVFAGTRAGYVVLGPKGAREQTVGFAADGPFKGPTAIAVNADESALAIVDPGAERQVSVYGSDGRLQFSCGPHGEGDGTFSMAVHAAWGPDGTLWVTDQIRHSISVFDGKGQFVGRIGGFGRAPGQFDYPIGCVFVAPDRVAVLERAGSRLQVLAIEVGKAWEPQARLSSFVSGCIRSIPSAEVN
jgi:DNA-binding beta-propeller fold protein YncE